MSSASPTPRDIDIRIASKIASQMDNTTGDYLVLTGSYSIDALTGADIKHNDIDANIFTTDIPTSLGRISLLLESNISELEPLSEASDRLEYVYPHQHGSTQVELQFVQYDALTANKNGINFTLIGEPRQQIVVPTVSRTMTETSGASHDFMVKSLPYAIGTWALRISGIALKQKRPVRQTDIDHYAYLVSTPHDHSDLLIALQHHPQMPAGYSAEEVLRKVAETLAKEDLR